MITYGNSEINCNSKKTDLFAWASFYAWLTFLCALFKTVVDLLEHGLAAALEHGQHDALEGVLVRCLNGPLHRLGRRSTNGVCRVLWTENGSGWEVWENRKGWWWKQQQRWDEDGHLPWIWPPCWRCPSAQPPRRSSWQRLSYSADLSPAPNSWRWLDREERNWQRQISRSNNTLMRVEDTSERRKERRLWALVSNTLLLLDLIQFRPRVTYQNNNFSPKHSGCRGAVDCSEHRVGIL